MSKPALQWISRFPEGLTQCTITFIDSTGIKLQCTRPDFLVYFTKAAVIFSEDSDYSYVEQGLVVFADVRKVTRVDRIAAALVPGVPPVDRFDVVAVYVRRNEEPNSTARGMFGRGRQLSAYPTRRLASSALMGAREYASLLDPEVDESETPKFWWADDETLEIRHPLAEMVDAHFRVMTDTFMHRYLTLDPVQTILFHRNAPERGHREFAKLVRVVREVAFASSRSNLLSDHANVYFSLIISLKDLMGYIGDIIPHDVRRVRAAFLAVCEYEQVLHEGKRLIECLDKLSSSGGQFRDVYRDLGLGMGSASGVLTRLHYSLPYVGRSLDVSESAQDLQAFRNKFANYVRMQEAVEAPRVGAVVHPTTKLPSRPPYAVDWDNAERFEPNEMIHVTKSRFRSPHVLSQLAGGEWTSVSATEPADDAFEWWGTRERNAGKGDVYLVTQYQITDRDVINMRASASDDGGLPPDVADDSVVSGDDEKKILDLLLSGVCPIPWSAPMGDGGNATLLSRGTVPTSSPHISSTTGVLDELMSDEVPVDDSVIKGLGSTLIDMSPGLDDYLSRYQLLLDYASKLNVAPNAISDFYGRHSGHIGASVTEEAARDFARLAGVSTDRAVAALTGSQAPDDALRLDPPNRPDSADALLEPLQRQESLFAVAARTDLQVMEERIAAAQERLELLKTNLSGEDSVTQAESEIRAMSAELFTMRRSLITDEQPYIHVTPVIQAPQAHGSTSLTSVMDLADTLIAQRDVMLDRLGDLGVDGRLSAPGSDSQILSYQQDAALVQFKALNVKVDGLLHSVAASRDVDDVSLDLRGRALTELGVRVDLPEISHTGSHILSLQVPSPFTVDEVVDGVQGFAQRAFDEGSVYTMIPQHQFDDSDVSEMHSLGVGSTLHGLNAMTGSYCADKAKRLIRDAWADTPNFRVLLDRRVLLAGAYFLKVVACAASNANAAADDL